MPKLTIPSKLPFNFENLGVLSEQFVRAIDAEFQEAIRDCSNRPKLQKPRDINILIQLTPVVNQENDDDAVFELDVGYAVSPVKRPKRVPAKSRIGVNVQNQGFFHADLPHEPNAKSLFEDQVAGSPPAIPMTKDVKKEGKK